MNSEQLEDMDVEAKFYDKDRTGRYYVRNTGEVSPYRLTLALIKIYEKLESLQKQINNIEEEVIPKIEECFISNHSQKVENPTDSSADPSIDQTLL